MSKSKKEETEVKTLTAKEIKDLCRPDFEANPDKYYPVKTLKTLGYSRIIDVKNVKNIIGVI